MRYTLLELVQSVMSSMDSDHVNSYDDTEESLQVTYVIRDTYNDIAVSLDLPKHYDFIELTASGSITKPTLMTIPTGVKSIEWIKYNNVDTVAGDASPRFVDVTYLPVNEFLNRMYLLSTDTDPTTVGSFQHTTTGHGTWDFLYLKDSMPRYYTSFNDEIIIFDGYDDDIDSTLQTSKTQAYGEWVSDFTLSNSFVPNLNDNQFQILLNESKKLAFAELKQADHAIARERSRRQWVNSQKTKQRVKAPGYRNRKLPNYGRK